MNILLCTGIVLKSDLHARVLSEDRVALIQLFGRRDWRFNGDRRVGFLLGVVLGELYRIGVDAVSFDDLLDATQTLIPKGGAAARESVVERRGFAASGDGMGSPHPSATRLNAGAEVV